MALLRSVFTNNPPEAHLNGWRNALQGRILTYGGSIQEFLDCVVPSASAYESADARTAFSAYNPTAEQSNQKCANLVRDVIILVPDFAMIMTADTIIRLRDSRHW